MKKFIGLLSMMLPALFMVEAAGMASVAWGATPQVIAGENHTIMLRSNGTVWSSGDNSFGQLGDGTTTARNVPVQVGTATDWKAVASGIFHTVALKADGTLWGWGDNTGGQLGLGTGILTQPTPKQIGADTNWKAVAAGNYHTLALKTDGTLWAWGESYTGQVGQISDQTQITNITVGAPPAPNGPPSLPTYVANHAGDVVYPGVLTQPVPLQVGVDKDWTAIAAGAEHSMALKVDGTLWGMGSNYNTQLGDATNHEARMPVKIGTDTDWASVSTRSNHTVAVKKNGTLFVWGLNDQSQLALPALTDATVTTYITVNRDIPFPVNTDVNWSSVAAGVTHTMAMKKDGTLWAWGHDTDGQCGYGTTGVVQATPKQVGADADWVAMDAGERHTVVMKANGTVWAMGDNTVGQLDNGSNTATNVPTPGISPLSGDLDQDGAITVADALRALRAAIGLAAPAATEFISGDVGPLTAAGVPAPDGNITIADAVVVLRKVVNLINF